MPRNKKSNPSNQKNSTCLFHQLEEDLVLDILSRLSVKNICTCRCVCKPWLFATYDPHFTRLHLSKSPSAAGVSLLIKPFRGLYKLYYHHIQQGPGPDRRGGGGDSDSVRDRDLQVESAVFRPHKDYRNTSSLVNSCNGLVCTILEDRIYICNPILRKQILLPSTGKRREIAGAALGFIKETNEYKVLQISRFDSADNSLWNYRAYIYTIGTGNWRSLGKTDRGAYFKLPVNYLLHGVAHWLSEPGVDRIGCIDSFDFESEQFQSIPLPSQDCLKLYQDRYFTGGFGVLKGCLFVCLYDFNCNHKELWIMEDYGVQESWTKLLVFAIRGYVEPIMFLRDEEILVITGRDTVICYNTAGKTEEMLPIPYVSKFEAISYTPSFVSVHDISHGKEAIGDYLFSKSQNKKFKELFPELSNEL